MKKIIFISTLLICMLVLSTTAFASDNISIIINGKAVVFTYDSGYPYIDQNNRTMVPLRVTMESAGATVGYDNAKSTAIVITEHNRIEVPIGTNILYKDNQEIQNDTEAVVYNDRTYLPIRAVLEAAGYTVEWDENSKSVNARSFDIDESTLVPYSTTDLVTLASNILSGKVVVINGCYYATPDFFASYENTVVHYSGDDLNTAIYPQQSRYDLENFDTSNLQWITGLDFEKGLASKVNWTVV